MKSCPFKLGGQGGTAEKVTFELRQKGGKAVSWARILKKRIPGGRKARTKAGGGNKRGEFKGEENSLLPSGFCSNIITQWGRRPWIFFLFYHPILNCTPYPAPVFSTPLHNFSALICLPSDQQYILLINLSIPIECKLLKGRGFCYFNHRFIACTCVAHSRHSVNSI